MRRNRFLYLCCIGLLCGLLLYGTSWADGGDKYGFGFRFVIKPAGSTKEYVAAVIKPNMNSEDAAAKALADHAYHWVIDRFKKAYPNLDPSKFDEMLATDTPLDGRSYTVVVYEKGHPENIQANMRMVFPENAEYPALPLEKNLNWKVPRQVPSRGEYPVPSLFGQSNEQLWQGNFVELKNLAVAEGVEQDFLPVLFAMAEEEASWNYSAQSTLIDMKIKAGKITAKDIPLELTAPSQYVVYCDERMVKHYQEKYGFKLLAPGPVKGRDHVMGVDRKEFVQTISRMKERPGGKLLKWEVIRPIQTDPEIQKEGLSILQALGQNSGRCLQNAHKSIINHSSLRPAQSK